MSERERVLIMHRNQDLSKIFEEMVGGFGYDVTRVEYDGKAAEIPGCPYAAAIIGSLGPEASSKIIERGNSVADKFVVISGSISPYQKEMGNGANVLFLQIPFKDYELGEALE